jgi:hypothetical protein
MRLKDQKGAFVVEFALILPIFLLLIFGIMDFGWYFFVQHTLQFATREGTRLALVGRQLDDPAGPPGQLLSREASIEKTIRENAALALNNPDEVQIYIFPVESDYQDPETLPPNNNAGDPGQYMRVKTRYTFRFMTPLIGAFFPQGKIDVQAQATYKNERFDTGG